MGQPKISVNPELFLSIADGPDVGHMFERFEWQSFTNGGYVIRARLQDPYWNILKRFATETYLRKGRKEPTRVIFEVSWPGAKQSTGRHLAYMADLDARGINAGGSLEFIAVDPPSYWLNAGDASGRVYSGKVSKVIKSVLKDYFVGPNGSGDIDVTETTDSDQNQWWMMRMDPKTFIGSLLEWSSSITPQKTNWIVSSGGSVKSDPTIWIKEQAERPVINYGLYIMDTNTPSANDASSFEFLADNFVSVLQRQLITHGVSAISERYLDRKTDLERKMVHVYDENTSQKKNVNINAKQGFTKPGTNIPSPESPHEWSTAVMAVPEFNAGDLGVTYDKYIDGRARGLFLGMLNLVMRIKLRIIGEASDILADSHNLGVSKLKIAWMDVDNKIYFMHGDWLVYGFHHTVTRGSWNTDIYCARLDHDASAQKV